MTAVTRFYTDGTIEESEPFNLDIFFCFEMCVASLHTATEVEGYFLVEGTLFGIVDRALSFVQSSNQ